MVENYYKILEVDPKASQDDIRRSYRRLAKIFHPDKNPSSEKEAVEAKFKKINEAYQVLSDPEKRKRYDDSLMIKVRPPPVVPPPSSSSYPPPRRTYNNNNHHNNPSPSEESAVHGYGYSYGHGHGYGRGHGGSTTTTTTMAPRTNVLYHGPLSGAYGNNQSADQRTMLSAADIAERMRRRRSTFRRWNPFRMLMTCFNNKN